MEKRVAILGAGSLGETLARGLLGAGSPAGSLVLAARRPARAKEVEERLGISCLLDSAEAARGAATVVVTVKPKDVQTLLGQISGAMQSGQILVSLAAGVSTTVFESAIIGVPVIRAMPNLPCWVGDGITAYAPGRNADPASVALFEDLFGSIGDVFPLEEPLLDAVTAVSGTGPAYAFLLSEAMIESALREGLPRDVAERLVNFTLRGAGRLLLESGESPAELRARVTSPGGTTAAAVHVLEERGFRAILEDAIRAAADRSRELGKTGRGDSSS